MPNPDRFFLDKADPDSWKALSALSAQVRTAAEAAGVPRAVVELTSVRISQLNRCAFCLDLHVRQATEAGISAQQLAVLPAWRETTLFSDVEQAALRLAEAVTTLPEDAARIAELEQARTVLSDPQYSALLWAAVTMNTFNRVSILSRYPVRPHPAQPSARLRTEGATTSSEGLRS